jgi:hypothetical protein
VKRVHLFELEDQPWFPATIRDFATDYLHFMQSSLKFAGALAPLVERAIRESGVTHIVDLCSGGSGPVPTLVERLAERGLEVTATLTDLYPNIPAFEQIARATDSRVTFAAYSVDARQVPPSLTGMRTIFNGFHHLAPQDARAVLHAADADRRLARDALHAAIPLVPAPLDVSAACGSAHVPVGRRRLAATRLYTR